MTLDDPTFWVALLQIIGVNIVLSGDNAVVIALAARSLPAKQQKQAVLWGSGAAVVMRIILTVVAVQLLTLPYLKLVGAALLLWIGVQLLLPEEEEEGGGVAGAKANTGMGAAIRTILIADLVMSLDNVIAVAAAAKGSLTLLILGLVISIPLVVFGSTILMKFMERWPIIITIGGGLLGWVAGEMAITDPAVKDWVDANAAWLHYAAPVLGAAIVVAVGKMLSRRSAEHEIDRPIVDLALASDQHGKSAEGTASRVLLVADGTPPSLRGVSRFVEEMRASTRTRRPSTSSTCRRRSRARRQASSPKARSRPCTTRTACGPSSPRGPPSSRPAFRTSCTSAWETSRTSCCTTQRRSVRRACTSRTRHAKKATISPPPPPT